MQKINQNLKTLIPSVILLVLGILFCCSLSIGIKGLSILIGIILLISGISFIVNALINNKSIVNSSGMIGISIVSFSIIFISYHLAGIIFLFIPWFLIILGVSLIADILIDKFVKNSFKLAEFIIKLILIVASIVLGLCLIFIEGFMEYSAIVLGILMIVLSIYFIVSSIIKK